MAAGTPWTLVKSGLKNDFTGLTTSTYSAQFSDEQSGITYVIGNYNDSFTDAATTEGLSYTTQSTDKTTVRGGMAAGIKTTWRRPHSVSAFSARRRCPLCIGSKVPPKKPILSLKP